VGVECGLIGPHLVHDDGVRPLPADMWGIGDAAGLGKDCRDDREDRIDKRLFLAGLGNEMGNELNLIGVDLSARPSLCDTSGRNGSRASSRDTKSSTWSDRHRVARE